MLHQHLKSHFYLLAINYIVFVVLKHFGGSVLILNPQNFGRQDLYLKEFNPLKN